MESIKTSKPINDKYVPRSANMGTIGCIIPFLLPNLTNDIVINSNIKHK